MKKQKWIVVLMVCVMTSLSACSNKENDNNQDSTKKTESTKTTQSAGVEEGILTDTPIMKEPDEYSNLSESKGFVFESNNDGTCSIKELGECKDQDIVIPEKSPNGDKVTSIQKQAFYGSKDIDSVVFDGKNMELDERAFVLSEVKKVVIINSNLVVGEYAFEGCDKIKNMIVDNSTLNFDKHAFSRSGKDNEITISNSKIDIGDDAFRSSDISKLSFDKCEGKLGEYAFAYCDDLKELSMVSCTLELEKHAFSSCGKDAGIVMKKSNINTGDDAFRSGGIKELRIEDCTSIIGDYAFAYCDDLENVVIGKGSTYIGDHAFCSCDDLVSANIGGDIDSNENIITIDDDAFRGSGLVKVNIAGGEVEIKEGSFAYCDDLKDVSIGKGKLKVEKSVFYGCSDELTIIYEGKTYDSESIENINV